MPNFLKFWKEKRCHNFEELEPDEIFLDSRNMPNFNRGRMEGNIERSLSKWSAYGLLAFGVIVAIVFVGRLWGLQIENYESYVERSENNRLRQAAVFAERGKVFDRKGLVLASNGDAVDFGGFKRRVYDNSVGLGNTLGFVKYPKRDRAGFYYQTEIEGIDGIEKFFNDILSGSDGRKIIEVDALNNIKSESVYQAAVNGEDVSLSVDSRLSKVLYEKITSIAAERGFSGGAGVVMDVKTGEVIAIASFPEYDPQVLTDGDSDEALNTYSKDERTPYLFRPVNGLYTPGSIVKPFIAVGVLNEKLIDPSTKILSTGSISIPNEYDPEKKSVFNDWKAHGLVDMRKALAVSSNVYFFEVGGGYESQRGLGISGIEKYLRLFGFGRPAQNILLAGEEGTIPNPEWKEAVFPDDPWRIGDTYNTSIGQYGLQVTPIQVVRAMGAIANDGVIVEPTILKEDGSRPIQTIKTGIPAEYFKVIKEGLRQGVLEGTALGINVKDVKVAAKTGTAEIGTVKKYVNSWVTGFFPYDNPRYAFAVIMERGPRDNTIGALYVARQFVEWLGVYAPEYLTSLPN